MNDKYLRDIILNFMLAGKDSTGNTLSWFLYMLCKNPLVQENIFQEIMDMIQDRDPPETERRADPDEFVTKITESVLDQMHYLHAALSETLRLYPAVPMVIDYIHMSIKFLFGSTRLRRLVFSISTYTVFVLTSATLLCFGMIRWKGWKVRRDG